MAACWRLGGRINRYTFYRLPAFARRTSYFCWRFRVSKAAAVNGQRFGGIMAGRQAGGAKSGAACAASALCRVALRCC